MEYNQDMRPPTPSRSRRLRTGALLASWALCAVATGVPAQAAPPRTLSAAGGWFFPNASDDRAVVDADGTLDGVPVWRTGRVLVGLESAEAAAAVRAAAGTAQVEAIDTRSLLLRLDLGASADDFAVSRQLRAVPGVAFAHPDLALHLTAHTFPDDPYVYDQWHLENVGQTGGTVDADIDAEAAWAVATGAGVLVSVIDSGVDPAHPDLRVTCGYDYLDDVDGCYPSDHNAHGTAAAGLIAATGNNGIGVAGVAYDASIFGVRLIGGSITYSDMFDAFESSVDAGAAVINNSWGPEESCGSYVLPGSMQRAFEYAEHDGRGGLGTLIVFSAGNGNCDMTGDGTQAHPTVVSVGAVDHNDRRESYSSFGAWMDVTGPSGGMLTTDISGEPGYGRFEGDPDYTPSFSGTSASAPVVSGVLALMVSANPDLTAADARAVLCATSDKVQLDSAGYDRNGWSPSHGCGRINAGAAVSAVANTGPGEAEPVGPTADPYADRVVLSWSAASDPDADTLTYTVEVTITDDAALDSGAPPVEPVIYPWLTGTSLDLTDVVAAGDQVAWTVRAEDAWTSGPTRDGTPFVVVAVPGPPEVVEDTGPTSPALAGDTTAADMTDKGGCSAVGLAGTGAAWSLVAFAALRRRRTP